MSYFRPNIDAMAGYVPGEQPAPGTKIIKLNTTENPYPPSPHAMNVLHEIDGELLRRYPHPMAQSFQNAASQALGVSPDWVLVGNGSDDLLTMLVRACTQPGRRVVYPMPTYVLYQTLASIQDADIIEVPFPDDYTLPVEALVSAEGAVTFVASPNSPSGTSISIELLDKLAAQLSGILVIDEAYADFADTNALDLVQTYNNVIVLRTLSKGYSLAGLRLGFGIANPTLLSGLIKVKDSYNVDAIACLVGAAAIADQEYKTAMAQKVIAERRVMADRFAQLGFYVFPSQSNFLLVQPPEHIRRNGAPTVAGFLYQELKQRGILVRYFKQSRLSNKLRVTVGTPEQNALLFQVLDDILSP
ncbi:MAG TPA: histidinol-phosphate transaminase [Elainellaceae cyanobacterium]